MSGRRQYNEDAVSIKLTGGGTVSVSFRGTLFDLTEPERALLDALISRVQQYRDSGSLNGNPAGLAKAD